MNKKILLKTLLPISAIALLGGGIATSLTLSSCSSKKVVLASYMQAKKYLAKNAVILPSGSYQYEISAGNYPEIIESQRAIFFNNILPVYNKQSIINGIICSISNTYTEIFELGGKITIENNKLSMSVEDEEETIYIDVSKFDSLNKFEIDTNLFDDEITNYIWDSSKSSNIQYDIRYSDYNQIWSLILTDDELTTTPPFLMSNIDVSAINISEAD